MFSNVINILQKINVQIFLTTNFHYRDEHFQKNYKHKSGRTKQLHNNKKMSSFPQKIVLMKLCIHLLFSF